MEEILKAEVGKVVVVMLPGKGEAKVEVVRVGGGIAILKDGDTKYTVDARTVVLKGPPYN